MSQMADIVEILKTTTTTIEGLLVIIADLKRRVGDLESGSPRRYPRLPLT